MAVSGISLANFLVDEGRLVGGAESVVDVDDADSAGTGIEHG